MNITQLARDLYEHKDTPESYTARPHWGQVGEVTKGVWLEHARRKQAGDPHWWSVMNTATAARFFAAITTRIGRTMSELNLKKLADQFDELAATLAAIGGTFRDAGGGGKAASDDAPPAKRPAAGKGKAVKVEEGSDEGLTIDTVREKLKELVEAKGKDKMVEALESVGAGKLADVDESQYQELVDAAQAMIDEEDEPAPKKPAAKKTSKKAAGPTLDEVKAAAQALIDADKPAYLKLTKKLGKPTEMDEGDYAAAIEAYTEAMPEEGDLL